METKKISNFDLFWPIFLLSIVFTPLLARAAEDYSACAALNDFLSYSKCVAEVDSQKSGQAKVVVEEVKSQEGEFGVRVGDGSGVTHSPDAVVYLTAPTVVKFVSLSKDSNFGFSDKLDFSAKKLWRLDDSSKDTQYVYVKFFDADGNSLKVLTGTIVYDTPRTSDPEKEAWAKKQYEKIYGKKYDENSETNQKFLEISVYGLPKNFARNLTTEKNALAKFRAVYKKAPSSGDEWSLVHALAYSQDVSITIAGLASASNEKTENVLSSTAVEKSCVMKEIKNVLDIGSKGEEVKALQTMLKCGNWLIASATIDGVYDSEVEAAVKKFQEEYSLKCTNGTYCGRFGPASAKKILTIFSSQANGALAEKKAEQKVVLKLGRNLTVGLKGDDVKKLQEYLAKDSANSGLKVSGTFDQATEEAIKRFQEKYGLKCNDGTYCGYIGPTTRKKLIAISSE